MAIRTRNDKQLVIWTPFNRARFPVLHKDKSAPHPSLLAPWIEPRYKLWKDTALKSVLAQDHYDFIYLVCCDPESKGIIDDLWDIKDERVVCQYSETPEAMSRIQRIGEDSDQIVTLRLDSDDMYHPAATSELMIQTEQNAEWYVFKKGYAYRENTRHMWYYDVGGSGPFFAHFYRRGQTHAFERQIIMNEPPHTQINQFSPVVLSPGKFIVNLTNMNTSTMATNLHIGAKIFKPQKTLLLSEFGIDIS